MESSPCIDGDRAIIGAGDDGVLCLALDPAPDGKPKKLWQLDGKDFPDCESAPIIHDGKLYFGLGRVVHAFLCADPKTGRILWRVDTPYPTGSGAIGNNKLYVPMGIGDFVNDAASLRTIKQKELEEQHKSQAEIEAELAKIKDVGELWCIDLETHQVDWKFPLPATSLGTAAVDGDRIYVGSRDGNLYCVSAAGTLINKFNAHGPIVSSPAVADRHVYVLTSTGTLFCLDKTTLSQVWSTTVGGDTFSSPTVADGHVYVGTNNGGFLSIGEPGREIAEQLWPGPLGGKAGAIDGSIMPATGTFAWASESASSEESSTPPTAFLSPAAAIDKTLYVGVRQDQNHAVIALAGGDDLAKKPAIQWTVPTKLPVTISPAASEKYVYFVEGQAGDKGRSLRCVDRKTGGVRWTRILADDSPGNFIITHDKLLIADGATRLTCIDLLSGQAAATELWHADVGPIVGAPAIAGDLLAVAVRNPPSVLALDLESHQALWSRPLPSAPRTGPIVLNDRVWVATAGAVHGLSLVHDEPPFTINADAVQLVSDDLHLACTTQSGTILVINPQSGAALPPIPDVTPAVPPLLAGDAMLYYARDSIRRFDLTSNQSTLWTKVQPSWLGTMRSPMIMIDSHLLFATDKRGLICMKPRKN
jgi:outer membrane protein assembly factor BamB